MDYCILTPIGPQKTYARNLYWDGIDELSQPPIQIYLYSKQSVHHYWMETKQRDNITWCQEPDSMKPRVIPTTTAAREALRKSFLAENRAAWALLLDPDIIPEPSIIDKFERFLAEHPTLIVLRSFHPSRSDRSVIRHGISCTFAHRDAMLAYPFTMACARGTCTGDDLIWLSVMDQLGRRRGLECLSGFYFDTKHAHEDGRVKELSMEYKRKLQC